MTQTDRERSNFLPVDAGAVDFEGRKILITGATGALGSALARHCVAGNAELVLFARRPAGLNRLYDELEAIKPGRVTIQPVNLEGASPQDYAGMAKSVGNLYALVHCAVHFKGLGMLTQLEPMEWMRSLQVNLNAAQLLTQALLGPLRSGGEGRVVFLSENLERMRQAYWGAYGVSKLALHALAQQYAEELEDLEIKVYSFNPGPFMSPIRTSVNVSENPAEMRAPADVALALIGILQPSNALPSGSYHA